MFGITQIGGAGPVYAGIVWLLVFATPLFVRMLAQLPEPATGRRAP